MADFKKNFKEKKNVNYYNSFDTVLLTFWIIITRGHQIIFAEDNLIRPSWQSRCKNENNPLSVQSRPTYIFVFLASFWPSFAHPTDTRIHSLEFSEIFTRSKILLAIFRILQDFFSSPKFQNFLRVLNSSFFFVFQIQVFL